MVTRRSHSAASFSYLQEVTLVALCVMMLPLFCFGTVGFAGNENGAIQSAVAPAAAVQAGEPIGSGDGRIHVIPSLSSPSVKNGGRLKIQAVVKAVEGVARVEALIERAGGEAAQPVDTLVLKPAPMKLGGVSADATVGLWQAEWDAHGLSEGYYTVALTVTDSTGHAFTDRSLHFSDPIAGNNTPGSAAYPDGGLRRLDAQVLIAGENGLRSVVIDPSAGYAYFGTFTSPGRVVKVALGSGGAATTAASDMTRLRRERIDTKSNLTGILRPGDEECGNQPRQELPGQLDHRAKRVKTPVSVGLCLNLRPETLVFVFAGVKERPHERSNGKSQFNKDENLKR